MFTKQGLGTMKHTFPYMHTVRSTISAHTHTCMRAHVHTHTHTHRENYKLQWKKCVLRAERKKWTEADSLMLLGRAFYWKGVIYLKACRSHCFVSQLLSPQISRNDPLADQRQWDGVYGRMSSDRWVKKSASNSAGTIVLWLCPSQLWNIKMACITASLPMVTV